MRLLEQRECVNHFLIGVGSGRYTASWAITDYAIEEVNGQALVYLTTGAGEYWLPFESKRDAEDWFDMFLGMLGVPVLEYNE